MNKVGKALVIGGVALGGLVALSALAGASEDPYSQLPDYNLTPSTPQGDEAYRRRVYLANSGALGAFRIATDKAEALRRDVTARRIAGYQPRAITADFGIQPDRDGDGLPDAVAGTAWDDTAWYFPLPAKSGRNAAVMQKFAAYLKAAKGAASNQGNTRYLGSGGAQQGAGSVERVGIQDKDYTLILNHGLVPAWMVRSGNAKVRQMLADALAGKVWA